VTRLGLLSDTHIPEAAPRLWPEVFDAFRGVDAILHAGDVHDLSVIDELARIAPAYCALGNGDGPDGRHPRARPAWLLEFDGVRVGLVHSLPIRERPPRFVLGDALHRRLGTADVGVVVHGDTHVEALDVVDGILCVNPGSATYPRNLDAQLGTVAFLELDIGRRAATLCRLTRDGPAPLATETVAY
jgi:uncharacterized protein